MLNAYLSYTDRDLSLPRKWAKALGNLKDDAIKHPVIAGTIAAVATAIGYGVWSAGAGIIHSVNESHDAAVARQVRPHLIKPTTPLVTSSSWGIQRQGVIMAGRIQYKDAAPNSPEAAINQILLKSEAPGEGQGGCTTVSMSVDPKTTSLLKYVFTSSVVIDHNLSATFNDAERFYCKPAGLPSSLRSQLPSIKPPVSFATERKI